MHIHIPTQQDGKGASEDNTGNDAKEEKHITCKHCGRRLMERRGVLRRLKPISNAFVVHGHCLACHSESEHSDDEVHQTEEGKGITEESK
mmetsp:Transcript_22098/g.46521  ORF Transcript_22098/g.46521 Transcript_22098/m.46521 type:complete len:90 (+) Transcript_22098:167-436(+)|eukprot:CAMPEP_0171330026 /NCGR_PEP_ID=MMETSP0878-20121228/1710_1 /TAXON_ID=67004 /ORGANISM="Thalassiosira weissflogii, Strain CCMP1336" /LENGTH=89 /DNA_ID=CAMNT_0011830205 /DNA_START=82 /DNA_END=351 /DNA_ORIENTATION=+